MTTEEQNRIRKVRVALERARALRRSRREFGVNGIHQFVENVDSEWLER